MLVPCEIAVKTLLPSIRAILAKELMTRHSLKQAEAAKLLGISQPAVSLYCRKMRGKAVDVEKDLDVTKLTENLAAALARGNASHKEIIPMLCEICKTVRAKGLMCKLHKAFEPTMDIEKCELCTVIATKCV